MAGFVPIKNERLYEKVAEQIKSMLQEGHLRAGDRLPAERDLAQRLGVSRAAVREALSALGMAGLVEVRPGEGTFVRGGDPIMTFAVMKGLEANTASARDMMELRHPLEGQAAYLAAQRATPEELAAMARILERVEVDLVDSAVGDEADWEFHLAIALAAHNPLLVRVMHDLQETLRITVATARKRLFAIDGMPERICQEHRAIYDAIVARQPEAARERMFEHIALATRNSGL